METTTTSIQFASVFTKALGEDANAQKVTMVRMNLVDKCVVRGKVNKETGEDETYLSKILFMSFDQLVAQTCMVNPRFEMWYKTHKQVLLDNLDMVFGRERSIDAEGNVVYGESTKITIDHEENEDGYFNPILRGIVFNPKFTAILANDKYAPKSIDAIYSELD